MSVSLHLISNVAKGLFKRAICQSGASLLTPGPVNPEQARRNFQEKILKHLGKLSFI